MVSHLHQSCSLRAVLSCNILAKRNSLLCHYGKPCLVYMHYSYAMLTNAEHQHATAVQIYNITTGTVCTDSA